MSGLRRAAEDIARTGIHPVLTAERLFAIERIAAELDALRVRGTEPWSDLLLRAREDLAALPDGALRRLIAGVWRDRAASGIVAALLAEALARRRRGCDRAIIESYLRAHPRDHPAFPALREAAALAAERHDWPLRTRGRRWLLWSEDAPERLRAAIAAGAPAEALLAEAGLTGVLRHGAFAASIHPA